ncbi:MAG TPA: signal recognition particle protein [Dehalococcoidales bacterium]|nr:signal recognition particle protein [Dehalococcoidales bacterium]
MFEVLTDKLSAVFRKLSSRGKLTEKDIDEGLRQVRLALLEADVNFKVVKDFVERVRARSLGAEVMESLTPAQQVIKIVNEELVKTLGEGESKLEASSRPPSVIMLVGLQGSGKTTTAAKLALHLKQGGQSPLLVAADTRRPAGIEQLAMLGEQFDIPIYREKPSSKSQDICAHGLKKAKELGVSWVIVDTAGRMHIDEPLMDELVQVKKELKPDESLLVVDAMTGQDAVRMAEQFHAKLGLTGLILTKMDGDARGGAALSIRWVSGVPIKFMGVGEKPDAFEPFYPDRLASRILGMGDMLTFIEKAEKTFDQKKVKELEKKVKTASFNLEDFLSQLAEIRKMGPVSNLLEMLPGASKLARQLPAGMEEQQLKKIEAMIFSMTPEERHNPTIIGGSRRRRIARGSGVKTQDVNQLLNQFRQMQKLMKMGIGGKLKMTKNMTNMFG